MNVEANRPAEEEPLDPAVERVRRKLVRFIAINLSILFLALMAVVAALVYRAMSSDTAVPNGSAPFEASLETAEGARILSHSASQDRLTVHLRNTTGVEEIVVYSLEDGALIGRFTAGPTSQPAVPD